MGILNRLDGKGFKPLAVDSDVMATSEQKGGPASTLTQADMSAALAKQNDIIERQTQIIREQNAKLKAMTNAVSALMGMVTRLKAEKPQAEATQKEESSTMAQLKKRFGL